MTRPTFSVVVPSHNYASFLPTTLDSVVQQDRDDVEVILVDDASTDTTPDVASGYPGVQYVRIDQNVGPGRAWAIGLERAMGRYVAKLDADDWQLPGWFDRMEDAFEQDPAIGLVAGSALLYRDGATLVERVTPRDTVLSAADLRRRLLRQFFFRMPAMCLRAEVLEAAAPPRHELRLPHDWEFFLRATRGWKAALLHDALAVYRIHTGSLTVTSKDENRLFLDYERLHTMISDADDPAYLEPDERRVAVTAMATGYLGAVGPRLSLRAPAAVRTHLRVAFEIASWGGPRAVAATGGYLGYGVWRRVTQNRRYHDSSTATEDLQPPSTGGGAAV